MLNLKCYIVRQKNEKLHKKVAYPLYLIAGMQPLSLYIVHEYKFFSTLLADTIIFASTFYNTARDEMYFKRKSTPKPKYHIPRIMMR